VQLDPAVHRAGAAGVPLGVTFTFLLTSPMINQIAVVMLFGWFGWKVPTLYVGSG
jgi:uncharacterized protein